MSTSIGTSRYTTVAALLAANKFVGSDRVHTPANDTQRAWLKDIYEPGIHDLERIPEIVANATQSANEHAAFLAKHGWNAQITECPPRGFLTAAVLDILVQWSEPGKKQMLYIDGVGEFPAARLNHGVELRQGRETGTVIASLATKSHDRVLLAMAPRAPTDVLDLGRMTDEIFGESTERFRSEGLIFPMVDLSSKQSLDYLVGLKTYSGNGGEEFVVSQAVQQAALKMNHEGARARAADEMGIRATSVPPPPFTIDRPFFVLFLRPGVAHSLYTAYVGHDAWKDPGNLGT